MKNKDIIIVKKIIEYCAQINEALDMFDNSFSKFKSMSVFQNACCMCILQISELCKLVSNELRNEETRVPWKEWCGPPHFPLHRRPPPSLWFPPVYFRQAESHLPPFQNGPDRPSCIPYPRGWSDLYCARSPR